MTVYMIAQMTIHDPETYSKYEDGFMEVFETFDGKILSIDDAPLDISGSWTASRSVLIEFPSKQNWQAWITSDPYKGISKHRISASTANAILVKGFTGEINKS